MNAIEERNELDGRSLIQQMPGRRRHSPRAPPGNTAEDTVTVFMSSLASTMEQQLSVRRFDTRDTDSSQALPGHCPLALSSGLSTGRWAGTSSWLTIRSLDLFLQEMRDLSLPLPTTREPATTLVQVQQLLTLTRRRHGHCTPMHTVSTCKEACRFRDFPGRWTGSCCIRPEDGIDGLLLDLSITIFTAGESSRICSGCPAAPACESRRSNRYGAGPAVDAGFDGALLLLMRPSADCVSYTAKQLPSVMMLISLIPTDGHLYKLFQPVGRRCVTSCS